MTKTSSMTLNTAMNRDEGYRLCPDFPVLQGFDRFQGLAEAPVSLNKYFYASGNPITGSDPSGEVDISLKGLLVTTSLVGLLIGAYYAPTIFQASTAAPRTVSVTIQVSTSNKPSTFNNMQVQQRLQQFIDTRVFNGLKTGQQVQIRIVDAPGNPGNLGWTNQGGLKTDYSGQLIWSNNIPFGGISFSQNDKTWVAPQRFRQQVLAHGSGNTDWSYIWANTLAHEMIWLNAAGNLDNLAGAQKFEISRPRGVRLNAFNDVNPDSRDELIGDFDLQSR